jgi:hypothetical protein
MLANYVILAWLLGRLVIMCQGESMVKYRKKFVEIYQIKKEAFFSQKQKKVDSNST